MYEGLYANLNVSSVQGLTLPVLRLIRIPLIGIYSPLRIEAQRTLSIDRILDCVIVPGSCDQVLRRGILLNPGHQCQQNIVLCVGKTRYAVQTGRQRWTLVRTGKVPWRIYAFWCPAAVPVTIN